MEWYVLEKQLKFDHRRTRDRKSPLRLHHTLLSSCVSVWPQHRPDIIKHPTSRLNTLLTTTTGYFACKQIWQQNNWWEEKKK